MVVNRKAKILITEDALLKLFNLEGGKLLGVRNDELVDGVIFLIEHKSLPEMSPGDTYRTIRWENE